MDFKEKRQPKSVSIKKTKSVKFLNIFRIDSSKNRVFGLDLLRAVAIILVLIQHSYAWIINDNFRRFIDFFLIDGVAVFFVLSGFLIGGIILKTFENKITLEGILNFWKRRWYRTLPNYFFILFLLLFLNFIFKKNIPNDFIYYPLFLQNLLRPINDFFPESWSLSIEEWFYIIVPVCVYLINIIFDTKKFKTNMLLFIFIFLGLTILLRIDRYFNLEAKNFYTYDRFFLREVTSRLDSIMLGVLGAWIYKYNKNLFYSFPRMFLILGLCLVLTTHNLQSNNDILLYCFSFFIVPFGILLTFPYFISFNISSYYLKKAIVHFSLTSYSLYLINLSLIKFWFIDKLNIDPTIKFILFWALSISISTLLYKYLELPILQYRDKVTKQ